MLCPADQPAVEARSLEKVHRSGRCLVHALRNVSFRLDRGASLAIMGPSGAGKSTLLNLLAGLDEPTSGEVVIGGERLAGLRGEKRTAFRRRHIGFVFQFFNLLPTMSAHDNVALPALAERLSRREVDERARQALDLVGLAHRAAHRPSELSGGEQQRVAIARALVLGPEVILADEPTGNLDRGTGAVVLDLLERLVATRRSALVLVTHDPVAASSTDRVVGLCDGAIIDAGALESPPGPRDAHLEPRAPEPSAAEEGDAGSRAASNEQQSSTAASAASPTEKLPVARLTRPTA